jgi:DNA-binding XRE family transcriptional regulator
MSREKLALTQPEFAKLLPASPRTVATLERGGPATDTLARRLTELERLTAALGEVMRADSIGAWLKVPNPAFGGLKPLEVIDRGEGDRLWEMIYFLRSGVAS